ncbi:MAG: ABC transporter permease [Sphingobacterium sp.]|nr:ABC transporter permease [Sphingobacterium sp.]
MLGVAGTVGVFVAMLALAQRLPGHPRGLRAPAERHRPAGRRRFRDRTASISLEELRVDRGRAAASPATPAGRSSPRRSWSSPRSRCVETGTDANVQVRGRLARGSSTCATTCAIVDGRFFQPGPRRARWSASSATTTYEGLDLGTDASASAAAPGRSSGSSTPAGAPSIPRCGATPTSSTRSTSDRRTSSSRSTVQLESESALTRLQGRADRRPAALGPGRTRDRLLQEAVADADGPHHGSSAFSSPWSWASAPCSARLNTMYSAVAERSREIATIRALGFGGGAVVVSFVVESLFIAFLGGLLGCLAVLPMNGFTTGTINWQTFSHLAFAFRITPGLLVQGIVFALLMGLVGGVPPAVRAVRRPVAVALRGLSIPAGAETCVRRRVRDHKFLEYMEKQVSLPGPGHPDRWRVGV